jgi:hypothetical protein
MNHDKFPRVVRNVAMPRGKQVMIEMAGKETELDRGLLEAIKDPLNTEARATNSSQPEQLLPIPSEDTVHVALRQPGLPDVIHAQLERVVAPEGIIRSEQEVIRAEGFLRAPERPWIAVHRVIPEIFCLDAWGDC